ncbi:MAG: NADH-quinone oxidoreductase subunit D, partial [Pseudomonadales bacterium]|nr:NADH-quinone oxidoreductase subunit D [Pseudomonadales bacterium]NIX09947.1 NADH-quinone oxidoreductase subunit D [Pseudomonadales bacterium]
AYESLLTQNTIWLQRTQGVGAIDSATAISHGMTGPALRATGVAHDLRRVRPYSGYENYDFEIPVGSE